jgi:hypothetical protein
MTLYEIYFKQWTWNWWYEVVKKNNLDCDELSNNSNITLDIVKENLDKKWNYNFLISNKSFNWEDIQELMCIMSYQEINPIFLSCNPNITLNIVNTHTEYNWSYNWLIRNNNIKLNDIKNYLPLLEKKYFFCIDYLSLNKGITWEEITQNPEIKWSYDFLTSNSNITFDIIKSNPDKNWNYNYLSSNNSITWEDIISNSNIEWNWMLISSNPNITWEIIQSNPNYHWHWPSVCTNRNITWEIILQSSQLINYDFHFLFNENISIEIFNKLIKKYKKYKNDKQFCHNELPVERDKYIETQIKQYYKLKEELMANVWHPKNFDKFQYLDFDTFENYLLD